MPTAVEPCFICRTPFHHSLMTEMHYNSEKVHVCQKCAGIGIHKPPPPRRDKKKTRGRKWSGKRMKRGS